MKFFVVDDSAPLREELVTQLGALPAARVVGEASTSEDAVRGIAATQPDVVTLDLKLAAGTGLDVLDAVRGQYPDMTIIVLTNHAEPLFRSRCLASGAQYFFDKSHEFDTVVDLCGTLANDRAVSVRAGES